MRRASLGWMIVFAATACGETGGDTSGATATTSTGATSSGTTASSATDTDATDGDTATATGDGDASAGDGDGTAGDGDASAGDGDGTTTSSGDGDGTTSSGDGDGTTAAGDGDGDGTSASYCVVGCTAVSDCAATPGTSTAFDEDNYACVDGGCEYLGCNSDAECQTSIPGTSCRIVGGSNIAGCHYDCASASDCDLGGGAAYDADNYACVASTCEYTGCLSDAECEATIAGTRCVSIAGSIDVCQFPCVTPSDCDMGGGPAFDADNYACDAGMCVYLGCTSDAECMATSPTLVCAD